jgi:sarcosine oxidase subunit alpha
VSSDLRLEKHPFEGPGAPGGRWVRIRVDGEPVEAREGESLAAAMLAAGRIELRFDEATGTRRGMYCGIGHCYECRVTVDGVPDVRSCLVQVREGMDVSTSPDQGRR